MNSGALKDFVETMNGIWELHGNSNFLILKVVLQLCGRVFILKKYVLEA